MISELILSVIRLLSSDSAILQHVSSSSISTAYPNKPISSPTIVCRLQTLINPSLRFNQSLDIEFIVLSNVSMNNVMLIGDLVIDALGKTISTEYCKVYGARIDRVDMGYDDNINCWKCSILAKLSYNTDYNNLDDRVVGDTGIVYVGFDTVKTEPEYKLADFYGSLEIELAYRTINSSALKRADGNVAFSYLTAAIKVNDVIFNRSVFYKVWGTGNERGYLADGVTPAFVNRITTINIPAYRYFLYQTISVVSGKKLEIFAPNAYIPRIQIPIVRNTGASYDITWNLLSSPTGELIRFAEEV